VLNTLTLAAIEGNPETLTAQIIPWWLKEAIEPSFSPLTDDDLDEALIRLDDAGAISLFDDQHGQTWFRLNQHQQQPQAPAQAPSAPSSRPRFPSPQAGAQQPTFRPESDPDCTRGARSLKGEGESAREGVRARERASEAPPPGGLRVPSKFCPEHRPVGPGFDEDGDPIACRVCGDYRAVHETWLIENGFRKPSKTWR
jgi:hypothetical protein